MKKLLLVLGVVLAVAGVLSLLFSAWMHFGYYHVLDGSPQLYQRLHERTLVFLAIGVLLSVSAAVCFFVHFKQ